MARVLALAASAAMAAGLAPSLAQYQQSLTGPGAPAWTVRNANGSISIPATVPGQVHLGMYCVGVGCCGRV